MSEKIEGTLVLDGLVEGHLPARQSVESDIRQWLLDANARGIRLHLESDGGSFNLLADRDAVSVDALQPTPQAAITEALSRLLNIFTPPERLSIYSTLRSLEYRPGLEVQTLYTISGDGRAQASSRTVETATTPPPQPLPRRQKLRLAGMGLGVAACLLLLSSLVVDYRELFHRLRASLVPLSANQIQVQADDYKDYFAVEDKAITLGDRLVLKLRRVKDYPATAEDWQRRWDQSANSLPARLSVEAMRRGYVQVEVLDPNGIFLSGGLHRVADLGRDEVLSLPVPLPRDVPVGKVVLTY